MQSAPSKDSGVCTRDLEQAHQLCNLMQESEIGFAVFDRGFRLLASNPAFRGFRALSDGHAVPGTPISDLIKSSLLIDGFSSDHVDSVIKDDLQRLDEKGNDRIVGRCALGNRIRISRHIKQNGLMVETITVFDADAKNLSEVSANPARQRGTGRARLLSAFEKMSDGAAIYDPKGVLIAVNQRFRELQPHVADLLTIGQSHRSIIQAVYRSGEVQLDDMTEEEFLAFAERERTNPSKNTFDQLKDGRWIRFSGRLLEDGSTVFVVSDVSELKKEQERASRIGAALERQNHKLDFAIESMAAGFVLFDKDFKLLRCNQTYRKMFSFPEGFAVQGVSRQQLMSKAIEMGTFTGVEAEQAQAVVDVGANVLPTETQRYHLSNGRVLQLRFTPIPGEGSMVLFFDVTAEVNAERQLQRNNRKLTRSNEELQSFAYVASHDLQEPLRKIEAFGDRLVKRYGDLLPEDGQLYVDRIQNAATRMRQLINDLLSFSRVTSNARAFEPVDLNEILTGVISDVQMRLEETNGKVVHAGLPTIHADALQMRQLFQNLISNALKFRRDGVDPVVTINAMATQDHVELSIADNGIGFDSCFREQIFAIFQRLHGRMEYEGTGIGLATCRKIVERHEGTISADGVEGEGAVFTVRLPRVPRLRDD